MTTVRAALFDLDGTLIDSRRDLADAVNALLVEAGAAPLPLDQVMAFVGRGARTLLTRSFAAAAPHLEPPTDDRWYRAFLDHYDRRLLDHTHLYDGVDAGLRTLQAAGVPMAVVSNKPEAPARKILDGLGVLDLFPVVLGGDSVAARKPAAEMLQRAAADLGVDLHRAWMIGDSDVDAEAAHAAGCSFLWCSWGGIRHERPEAAEHVAASFAEVVDRLLRAPT